MLKIARDGTVEDLIAEQVNLTALTPKQGRARLRRVFAEVASAKARNWTFLPPTEGPEASAAYWVVRVPITFDIDTSRGDMFLASQTRKKWQLYLPGPRQTAPWREQQGSTSDSDGPDALPGDGVFSARGEGVRLRTPLQNG